VTRTPWITAAAVLVVLTAVFAGTTQLISETFRGSEVRDETLTSTVPRLELNADQGEITLVPSADGRVHARAESSFGLREPVVTTESGATGVRLASRCLDGFVAAHCETRWTVAVPADFGVVVDGGTGRVRVQDLTGPVTIDADADVALSGLTGDVTVRASYGDVTGAGLRTPSLSVSTRSGDVDVALSAAPRSVSLTSSDQGDLALAVPGTQAYRIDADHGLFGDQRITVPENPGADATLHAATTGGQVTIRPT